MGDCGSNQVANGLVFVEITGKGQHIRVGRVTNLLCRLLQVSPGSTLLLRGHVDNAKVAEFRKTGGEAYVRTQALRAMELSKNRAAAIRQVLIDRYSIDPKRIDTVGRGWEEPAGPNSDLNRRVEVQWFTVE